MNAPGRSVGDSSDRPVARRNPMPEIITDASGERVEAQSQHDSTDEEKERRRDLVRSSL